MWNTFVSILCPPPTCTDSSDVEELGAVGGREGEGGEEGMASLRKKMKELSAAHDMVLKNRCVCVCVCVCVHIMLQYTDKSIHNK